MAKTAAQMAANYQSAMASGTTRQKYIDGINGYQGNPMADAATPAAMQRYQDGVMASITSGRRARGLQKANPAVWKQNAVQFGAAGLASGAQKAKSKVDAHFADWASTYEQASQAARAIQGSGMAAALQKVEAVLNIYAQKSGKTY